MNDDISGQKIFCPDLVSINKDGLQKWIEKILTYDSVEISFGGKAVVHDVSFSLEHGEILGLVGESGSGKSTIAKLLTRLTDITEGTLKFEGKDITRLKQSQLKEVYGDIQMVFQNPVGSFDPRRTLGDGIGESLRNRGMKKVMWRKE